MKNYFCEKELKYDGSQLQHLYAYLNFKILGDSVVSWVGACDVSQQFMADGEDLIAGSEIRGAKMLHFIIEKFEIDFYAGVTLQRLISSLAIDVLRELSQEPVLTQRLTRSGDDIYLDQAKLSISIAKKYVNSVVIHFAVNIENKGTPVKTLSLSELKVSTAQFAKLLMERLAAESISIIEATQKVI